MPSDFLVDRKFQVYDLVGDHQIIIYPRGDIRWRIFEWLKSWMRQTESSEEPLASGKQRILLG
jgi:hypothetical protein